jgi:tRNA1(Val) A37 N6-methylase TrmN6
MADNSFTDNAVLGGALMLRQPKRGHRVGHDAILLAAATPARAGDHAVEFGAGVGAAGLALAHREPEMSVNLVEIDPELAAIAARNVATNRFSLRVRVITLDVAAPARAYAAAGLIPGAAQRVLMNPPFNDPARQRPSPDAQRRRAHGATRGALAQWTQRAGLVLANAGTLTLIWRADGIADVLAALAPAFGDVAILPVYPRPDAAAIRILVGATKGSRAPLTLLPGLTLNDAGGRPTAEAEAVLRGGAVLPLARR